MIKPTKRRAFNFLRSYFDVFNELESEADQLNFIKSILNKQFLDESPKDLNFIVNLCYESQRHQIESSVKGWKRVNKDNPITNPTTNPPTIVPTNPTTNPQEEEEEEEEEEKEKGKEKINWSGLVSHFNTLTNKKSRIVCKKGKEQILARLKEGYTKANIVEALYNCSKDPYHLEHNLKWLTIEFISRPSQFDKWLNAKPAVSKKSGFAWD